MAAKARDHFGRLPTELFCLVVEDHGLSTRDFAALAATCHKNYTLANPILYQKHLKETGGQAILWAVERNRFTTLRRFLENGADINNDRIFRTYVKQKLAADNNLASVMHLNINNVLGMLWDPWPADFCWHPQSTFTPLALAASRGQDSMVAFLLDHGADIEKPGKGLCACGNGENVVHLYFPPDQDCGWTDDIQYIMDDENGFCWTPLHFALCQGHESTAMLLIDRGADCQVTCPCEAGPWNALHTATRLNHRKIIDHLLDKSLIDINEAGHKGLTPIHLAFYEENYSLVDMYIDRGADTNAIWHADDGDGDWTLFAMACLRDEFSRASDLLQRGANPDFVLTDLETGNRWTALGLIYGNLYGRCQPRTCYPSLHSDATETHSRLRLEDQIMQVRIDKALQQQRKETD